MVKIQSEMVSLIYIGKLRITPDVNTLTDEQFAELKERGEYKQLIKDRKFILLGNAEGEIEKGEKALEDLNVAELKAYAKELGIEGMSNAKREDLLATIKEVEEA